MILGVNVTAGNVHDSVAWDSLYDEVTERFPDIKFVMMDAAYKTAWISKKILDDGRIPILPYTRYHGKKEYFRPWDYRYDELLDMFTCPCGETLRHTTTDREGKRIYRSNAKVCRECPCRALCGVNRAGQKILQTHIWQEYLNLLEELRKTELGKGLYAKRKETIERAFADAKEKHGMRYTHHRGLARVTNWVKLKYAAMNLKKLATWSWKTPTFQHICSLFFPFINRTPILLR
ncbi:MAG: transposase [Clostridia bacterium]|nr:transposase [Clostridia bacterium]